MGIAMNVPSSFDGDIFEAALNAEWYGTDGQITYPSCTFWDASNEEFSDSGCWVFKFNSDSITCAYTHLTTFRVSTEDFDPKVQTVEAEDWKYFTLQNIAKHPTTWVTMLMIVVVLVVACICVPNNNADK